MTKKKALLLDMNNVFMRAYHATKHQGLSHDGINTGSIKSCYLSVLGQVRDHVPTHVAAVWDNGLPTFRDELVSDYKGQRQKPKIGSADFDPAINQQKTVVRQLLKARGLYTVIAPKGVEADDVIGMTARKFPGRVVITSDDKDLSVEVTEMVAQQTSQWGLIGPKDIKRIWGVEPAQLTELLMLAGDSVDNVKGAGGIGKKTAASLLNRYGSIERIFTFIEDLTPSLVAGMLEFEKRQEVCRALITLCPKYSIKNSNMEIGVHDVKAVKEIAKRWNMSL